MVSVPLRCASIPLRMIFQNATRLLTTSTRLAASPTGRKAAAVRFNAEHPDPASKVPPQCQTQSTTVPREIVEASDVSHNRLLVTNNRCTDGLVPVGKLLASRGVCSRGEGDEFFSLGLVFLNGRRLERNEAYVHPDAPLRLAPRAERLVQQKVTILLHKPMHFLSCQTDKQARGAGGKPLCRSLLCPENFLGPADGCNVLDPRRCKKLVAAGRLDTDSSGLQVFTQDGRIAAQLVGGTGDSIAKEYIVQVDVPPSEGAIRLLQSGLSLDGCELLPAKVRAIPPEMAKRLLDGPSLGERTVSEALEGEPVSQPSVFFSIELHEGRNRQIRRMCELVGLRALRIHRVRIGNIDLGSLPRGCWRHLLEGESFC